VLTQGSGWLSSFTKADNRPSLDIVSARRYSDDGGSSGASKVSRIGETSRVLLSLLHSVINNLLSESQAAEVFEVISNNTNRKLFKALVATPSPESKTIAGMFLPAAIECLDVSLVKAMLATGFDPNSHVRGADRGLLVAAINSCNIDIVRQFLDHGASVNVQSYKWHETPLEAAARTGRVDLVRLLLNAGANLNVPARDHGASVLSSAAYHGDLELMQLLIDAGADVRGPTCRHPGQGHMNTTAIRVAAMLGNLAMAKLLLSYGADVNTLSHAAISGKLEMLQLLLDHGANDVVAALRSANCPERSDVPRFLVRLEIETHGYLHNAFQMAAFRAAIRCHDLELTNRLLDSRMSFRLTPASLTIALDIAVRMGTFPVVELLVARGANVNGQGILQWAISLDRFEIVQLLLRSGADVNAPGVHHKNLMAFALAICRQRLEIARLLLDFGVDMNKQGPSAVIEAIDVASPELLQLVVGAWVLMGNVDMSCTVDRLGKSPLDVAARRATVELTKILLDNKVYRTGDVSLALPIAIENSNWEVAKLLLASGADIGPNQHKEEGTEGRFYCVGTALDRAAQASHVDMLKILLQYETSADQRSQV
jgi:ankyrin repeat protein